MDKDIAQTIQRLSGEAVRHFSEGQFVPGISSALQAVALAREHFGAENAAYAEILNFLSLLFSSNGDFDQAVPQCLEALAIRRRVCGEKSLQVGSSLLTLARIYSPMGERESAISMYRQGLEIFEMRLPPDDFARRKCSEELAELLKLEPGTVLMNPAQVGRMLSASGGADPEGQRSPAAEACIEAFCGHDYAACAERAFASSKASTTTFILMLISLDRLGQREQASAQVASAAAKRPEAVWETTLFRLSIGEIEWDPWMEQLRPRALCSARFCAGAQFVTVGKVAEARRHLEACAKMEGVAVEAYLAKAELEFIPAGDGETARVPGVTADKSFNMNSRDFLCGGCGNLYRSPMWIVVDAGHREDLLNCVYDGTIQVTRCPHCGVTMDNQDLPLLVYRSSEKPHLVYSPSRVKNEIFAGLDDPPGIPSPARYALLCLGRAFGSSAELLNTFGGRGFGTPDFPEVSRDDLPDFLMGLA